MGNDQLDFLDKVVPLAERIVEERGFTVRKGNAVTRAMNLAMGLTPRTKAERELQTAIIDMIADAYPGRAYPALCPPHAKATVH